MSGNVDTPLLSSITKHRPQDETECGRVILSVFGLLLYCVRPRSQVDVIINYKPKQLLVKNIAAKKTKTVTGITQ